ncbi:DUF1294 domain-containing protein [Cytobacillus purgationiresistens]|uniref:Uncharacterized membrane protein YsdA (DUF1294 family) n=1 Tax=Cytobacillus purgationiresistens TaxID=863449 RepID=A0ABU0AH68_9BACI|nr:DUF1294 domain-containing protein [Cytobacillus purgationiresistens]MDQ0270066.1 uncharacterized membrane protein YsdA (DUF1294 family) [Cytobacillus purgationiresistens]
MLLLVIYLIVINIIGFFIMRADKERARKNEYRISENTLWTIALLLGAIGMTAGMKQFRHKTKHSQFKYGLPLLSIIDLALILYISVDLS